MKDRWHVRCNSRKVAKGQARVVKFRWRWQAERYIVNGYRKMMWGFYYESVDLIDTKKNKIFRVTR